MPAFELVTRTSLQSFRFLPQNPCIPRPARAVEITRTSLQSLAPDVFDVFCSVLFATGDCVVHNPGDPPGNFFDTRVLDMHPANAYCGLAVISEMLSFSLSLPYWSHFFGHSDRNGMNNTSGSLHADCAGKNSCSSGR